LLHLSSTRTGNILFNENFQTTVATPWQQHHIGIKLHPLHSFIPGTLTVVVTKGTIKDLAESIKEWIFTSPMVVF
jgi:hypothetical protein